MTVWDQIKQELAKRLSTESFQNWLAPTQQKSVVGSRLIVAVSSDATKVWLEQEYGEHVAAAIAGVGLGISRVEYEVAPVVTVQAGVVEGTVSALNPKYSFASFVVGSCNQFAHAAAKAVADNPAERYNPLFIYGGVGMGKTHLMHAIGRTLADRYGSMKIIYTSSEKFMNEMIDCIKTDRMSTFHQHYRTADILLMDDVQVLANKERTQEEFFHTFNALHENGKQIVLSSDQPPKQTQGLTDRLRSRFEWGLMVDVQPPDLETKMAILDKKAEAEGIHLPEDVRIYIATKTKSNVRELEGALVKLVAYSSVMDSPITLGMAQQVLKQLSGTGERRVTIELIVRAVAERFNLQPAQLKLKTNVQNIAYPRQVAMYLAKEMTPSSLPEIGRYFGGKHHTTVLHSVQKIDKLRQRDGDLNRLLHSLTDSI
ncbi:MAG: chromosomal replication initiator protein DnaA [Acidobacteriaceae bacterium]|jgi:chromosomal replication initiator protein|nr:chromosomal replication initiator protein DnaA [Acidobacteriaceae bacterium]